MSDTVTTTQAAKFLKVTPSRFRSIAAAAGDGPRHPTPMSRTACPPSRCATRCQADGSGAEDDVPGGGGHTGGRRAAYRETATGCSVWSRAALTAIVASVARMMCPTNGRISHQYRANFRRDTGSVVAVRHS